MPELEGGGGMSQYLTEEQVAKLLEPIHPRRVSTRDGMAYVEAHDVKAHLTRIFGFARWSSDVIDQQLIAERQVQTKNGKDAFYVCYRSIVRLTICAPDGTVLATYTEGHVGDSTHPTQGDAHGNALTNSESYALKRCAIALGDQFGLSLYNRGQTSKIVGKTLVAMPGEQQQKASDVDADIPQIHPEELTQPEPEPPKPVEKEKAPVASTKEVVAAGILEKLHDLNFSQPRGVILRAVTSLKIEAGKARCLNEPVNVGGGISLPLTQVLDDAIGRANAA